LLDVGEKSGVLKRAGAYYSYNGLQLGQGINKASAYLKENTLIRDEIESKVREAIKRGDAILTVEPEEDDPEHEIKPEGYDDEDGVK